MGLQICCHNQVESLGVSPTRRPSNRQQYDEPRHPRLHSTPPSPWNQIPPRVPAESLPSSVHHGSDGHSQQRVQISSGALERSECPCRTLRGPPLHVTANHSRGHPLRLQVPAIDLLQVWHRFWVEDVLKPPAHLTGDPGIYVPLCGQSVVRAFTHTEDENRRAIPGSRTATAKRCSSTQGIRVARAHPISEQVAGLPHTPTAGIPTGRIAAQSIGLDVIGMSRARPMHEVHRLIAVVNEDRRGPGEHIVRVLAPPGGGGEVRVRRQPSKNQRPHQKEIRWGRWVLCGTSDGVIPRGDADPDASDHFERMRIEVELKVVSRSLTVVHVSHKKAPLSHFGKTRKAFRGPDDRPAAPLRGCHPATQGAPKHRRQNGVEPDIEMRSRKQCIFGLNTDLGSGLPRSEQFTRGYLVHLIAA